MSDEIRTTFELPKDAQTGINGVKATALDIMVVRIKGEPVPMGIGMYHLRHASHWRAATDMVHDPDSGNLTCSQCGQVINMSKDIAHQIAVTYANGNQENKGETYVFLVLVDGDSVNAE